MHTAEIDASCFRFPEEVYVSGDGGGEVEVARLREGWAREHARPRLRPADGIRSAVEIRGRSRIRDVRAGSRLVEADLAP